MKKIWTEVMKAGRFEIRVGSNTVVSLNPCGHLISGFRPCPDCPKTA